MTDFARLFAALHKGRVEFILVGGVAATVHGSSRLTQDVDIVYARTDRNLKRLVAALKPLRPYLRGAPAGLPFAWSVETLRGGLNFTLTTRAGDLDLLPHTLTIALFGHPTTCLNLAWLIRTKRAAGRPRDLEAIAELEVLREEAKQRGSQT